MAKVGDIVRYLNTIGGGKITKIEGNMAFVDEDGFETPVLLKELVVVMPEGHNPAEKQKHSGKMMFDQAAFDAGREKQAEIREQNSQDNTATTEQPAKEMPIEETKHGDKLNIVLAFEPQDIKHLPTTGFSAVLVNDSNYYLHFVFSCRATGEYGWKTIYSGTAEPNMLIDLATYTHDELPSLERIALQYIAFKKDKEFEMKAPVSVTRRTDLTKFYKMHCFRPGIYFDTPVLEIPIVKDDVPASKPEINPVAITEAMMSKPGDRQARHELSAKLNADKNHRKADRKNRDADNPHKLLPLIEIDLHIGELTDTTSGMTPADMLEMQLDTVRRTMEAHSRRIGQKIVFIHGKGEGVLRKAVLELLRRKYPKAELQDASFREYGFGATLVTIH